MDLSKAAKLNLFKILIFSVFLTTIACGEDKGQNVSSSYASLDVPKMSCVTVGDEIHCQGIDIADPNGVPSGCSEYAQGNRQFLNGTLASATAYDCGYRFDTGLRCFYFWHEPNGDDLIEDVVCQPDYS
jgi:hypothetical protein